MKKVLSSLAIATLLLTACSSTETGGLKNVKIGVITPMTGDAAVYGQEMKRIYDYELPLINQDAAKNGYSFELVFEDGQCGSAAATSFQKLSDLEGIQFLIGGACSSESLAIAPLLEGKNVVAISALSSSPELDGISPNFLSLSYSDAGVGEGIADEMSSYSKVAILTEQNDYNIALRDTVLINLSKNSSVVADETVEKGATDFRNALEKIKAASPDVVYFNINVGVTSETMLKQLFEMKDWKVAKVGTFTMMDDDYIKLSPDMMEGFIVVDTPKTNSDEFLATEKIITETQGTVADLGAYYTATTLDALSVMTEAIMNSEADPTETLKQLRSKNFDGYIGKIFFGDSTFVQGIGTAVYTVQNGIWTQK